MSDFWRVLMSGSWKLFQSKQCSRWGGSPEMNTWTVFFIKPSLRQKGRCKVISHPLFAPFSQNITSYIPGWIVQWHELEDIKPQRDASIIIAARQTVYARRNHPITGYMETVYINFVPSSILLQGENQVEQESSIGHILCPNWVVGCRQ